MITPKGNDLFEIHPEATEIHEWTKEDLLKLPIARRPTIKEAWTKFFTWAISRAKHKGSEKEDLRKAMYYLKRIIDGLEE